MIPDHAFYGSTRVRLSPSIKLRALSLSKGSRRGFTKMVRSPACRQAGGTHPTFLKDSPSLRLEQGSFSLEIILLRKNLNDASISS